jgi:fructuronate reductase
MIDKITPRPDPQIESMLKADGIEDIAPVITERKTYVAPFVNAEEPEYLVVEDDFPNGRPPLEKGGVIFTDRATVDKSERMKVCTCLNPLHTSLAVFGSLLGCEKMSEAIGDPDLRKLVEGVGYKEGLPVVTNPGILDPKEFIDTVVNVRIPNPYLPDTPQRIMTDTSQKVPIRFGETIKAYQQSAEHSTEELKLIPLVFAGWLRYILGVDDNGKEMERSADPALPKIDPYLQGIRLGDTVDAEGRLHDLLANRKIFGVNLYEAGLADKVKADFLEMIKGPGAVRTTLHRMVS